MARQAFVGISVFMWRFISYYISIIMGIFVTTWYINQTVVDSIGVKGESDVEPNGTGGEETVEMAEQRKAASL